MSSVDQVSRFFDEKSSVKYVRLQWVDFSGVLRTRSVTKARCLQLAAGKSRYTVPLNCMIVQISTSRPNFNTKGIQVWELHPDWQSLTLCGFAPKHASVMCFVDEKGRPEGFAKCPRRLLTDTVESFQREHATSLLLGFEIEFVLLNEALEIATPLDRIVGQSLTQGLRAETLKIVEKILESLEDSNIAVHHFHTESADQLEIALSPMTAVMAIDAVMQAQETIRTICVGHGLKATLAPRPSFNASTNGCHMHLSMNPAKSADSFLAGILEKMTALCAFGMPSFDSYTRIKRDATGVWIGFGTESRDLPIRKITEEHWEFRFLDSTANIYLFLAAVLAAGSAGVSQARPLVWKDCPVFLNRLSDAELAAYGIVERMPHSLSSSLDSVKHDEDIESWLGRDMLSQYVDVKEKEVENFGKMADEERRKIFLKYF